MGCPRDTSLKMMGRYGSSPAPTPCRNTIGRSAELPALLLLLLSWMMVVLQLAVVEGRGMVDRPRFMGALQTHRNKAQGSSIVRTCARLDICEVRATRLDHHCCPPYACVSLISAWACGQSLRRITHSSCIALEQLCKSSTH